MSQRTSYVFVLLYLLGKVSFFIFPNENRVRFLEPTLVNFSKIKNKRRPCSPCHRPTAAPTDKEDSRDQVREGVEKIYGHFRKPRNPIDFYEQLLKSKSF